MSISHEVAQARGRVAGITRAVRNGERSHDHTLIAARQELALAVLAERAREVAANWPDLSEDQLARIATILRGGA